MALVDDRLHTGRQARCLRSYTFRQVAAVGSDFHAPVTSLHSDSNYLRSIQMTAPVASQAFRETEKQEEKEGNLLLDIYEGYEDQTNDQCSGANEKITALNSHFACFIGAAVSLSADN